MHRQATTRGPDPALGRLSVGADLPGRPSSARPSTRSLREEPGRRAAVLRRPGRARAAPTQIAELSADARRARGRARPRDHQRRQPGADARRAGDRCAPATSIACEDPSFMSVIRALRDPGVRRARRARSTTTGSTSTRSRRCSPATRSGMLAIQPRLHNPTGRDLVAGAARAPARARPPPRLLRRSRTGSTPTCASRAEDRASLRAEAPAHVIYCDSLSKTVGGRPARRLGRRQRPGARPDRRREARRRHPQPDPDPARRRPLPRQRRLPGAGRARARLLRASASRR